MNVFAIDLGGSRAKFGLIVDGSLMKSWILPVTQNRELQPVLDEILRIMRAGLDPTDPLPEWITIAYPGVIAPNGNRVTGTSEKYDDARDFDWETWSQKELGCPIRVDNDARLAAKGEWAYGAAKGQDNWVMVTLGTGIGTTVVVDGRMLKGAHGTAGILGGHLSLDPNGKLCSCGQVGCAEGIASGREIANRLGVRISDAFRILLDRIANHDEQAVQELTRCLNIWGTHLINLVHAYDPSLIVLGGGIGVLPEVLEPLKERIQNHHWLFEGQVNLVPADLGANAALYGGYASVDPSRTDSE